MLMNGLKLTKITRPQIGRNCIKRNRLLELLSRQGNVPIINFVAPAGYGKSTLLIQWAAQLEHPCCWLSLDNRDNEPRRFINYLASSLASSMNNPEAIEAELSEFHRHGKEERLITALLDKITQPTTLIIDDVHLLAESASQFILKLILERLPEQLQLVISGRNSRFIDLNHYRLQERCFDVTKEQLKFDYHELVLVVTRKVTRLLDEPEHQFSALYQATEGWPAGVQLTLLASPDSLLQYQASDQVNEQTVDYLAHQILSRQSPELQTFLLRTSYLDRFTPALANQVCNIDNSSQLLNSAEKNNLFINKLDSNANWYQYHPLFRKSLNVIANNEGINSDKIFKGAYHWCLENKLKEEAISYALLCGAESDAANLVDELAIKCIRNGQFHEVDDWIGQLKEVQINQYPRLIIYRVWALSHLGHLGLAGKLLRTLKEASMDLSDDIKTNFLQEYTAMQMVNAIGADELQQVAKLAEKMNIEDFNDDFCRGVYHNVKAIVEYNFNRPEQSLHHIKLAMEAHQQCDSMIGLIFAHCITAIVNIHCGDLISLEQTLSRARQILRRDKTSSSAFVSRIIRILEGVLCFYQGAEEQALSQLFKLAPYIENSAYNDFRNICFSTLIRGMVNKEEYDAAQSVLDNWQHTSCECITARTWVKIIDATLVIYLAKGDLLSARQLLAQQQHLPLPEQASDWDDLSAYPQLSYCRLGVFQEGFDQIPARLKWLAEASDLGQRVLLHIEIKLLQVLYQVKQQAPTLHFYQEQAVMLIESNGIAPKAYQHLLKLFPKQPTVAHSFTQKNPNSAKEKLENKADEITPLSDRELEVLKCMADGMQNKNIADKLYLSVNTIRWHASNIFSKLSVSNRTQAVGTARDLGLI
jgi:LuxR family maltose regulon positive regulatory protein